MMPVIQGYRPDADAVKAFRNFLSWGEIPHRPQTPDVLRKVRRPVPPAWWAYALGSSTWCPPKGEL